MTLDVSTFKEIKTMDYRDMKKFFDHLYREAFKDGYNAILKIAEKRLETVPEAELRSQYQLGVYDALTALKKEVDYEAY